MEILKNDAINDFFNRCLENIDKSELINSYIGLDISQINKSELLAEMREIGYQIDNLYLSIDDYCRSPYHKNIRLDKIKAADMEYDFELLAKDILINVGLVQDDPNKELNDTLILKAYDKRYKTTILKQNGEYWMSDTPQEAITIDPFAKKAYGKTLTFGLGIGYFPYMASLNTEVEEITIVERSQELIEAFRENILPQFNTDKKITIINGDAYDYFNDDFLKDYDYVFVDIHKSIDDGFEHMVNLLDQANPRNYDFWIEDNCLDQMKVLIFLYFYDLYFGYEYIHNDKFINGIFNKIERYFAKIDEVCDVERVKYYIYSKEVKRGILTST